MQKGLDLLLKKYSAADKATFTEDGFVEICGEKYPTLPWNLREDLLNSVTSFFREELAICVLTE